MSTAVHPSSVAPRGSQTEYLLKGVFLGLLVFVALTQAADSTPEWLRTGEVALWMLGGLAISLLSAAIGRRREVGSIRGRVPAYILFLLLENPRRVYAGLLLGLAIGALRIRPDTPDSTWLLAYCVGGGAALGLGLDALRHQRAARTRLGLGLVAIVVLVGAVVYGLEEDHYRALKIATPAVLGMHILLGLPFFYLLTFVGEAEESEAEIAALCAALGVAAWLVKPPTMPALPALGFLLPITLYYFYATRVLPGLRVFKYTLRGFSDLKIGRLRAALLAFRRARQLAPNNQLAREGLWRVHRAIDLGRAVDDPELLALLDLEMCLERAASLLVADRPPTPAELTEARQLLHLVVTRQPSAKPQVDYYRVVADAHARDLDAASATLAHLLDPAAWSADDSFRRAVLLTAWQLALTQHPELRRRVGEPQLEMPGRRMDAIAAVERRLAEVPDDPAAWDLKRLLYAGVTEPDYSEVAGPAVGNTPSVVAAFDHAFARELGLSLIDDPERWQRGAAYLRLAAHGLPERGPSIFLRLAQACEKAGERDDAERYLGQVKRAGQAIGVKALAGDERQAYFATVKRLADEAAAREDLDAAIADYHLYAESEQNVREIRRTLADLYERRGDALAALHATEMGLVYDGNDADFLARRDKYYSWLTPAEVQNAPEAYRKILDADYCLRKARRILDSRTTDLDNLDWALQLATLARTLRPDSLTALVLRARAHLAKGERTEAVTLLEDVRTGKPERFASTEDQDAWYESCQRLGRLYLDELDAPQLAVEALKDFRESSKSGADTWYHLGRAYEQLNDLARACSAYKHLSAYPNHPLAADAADAVRRLQADGVR